MSEEVEMHTYTPKISELNNLSRDESEGRIAGAKSWLGIGNERKGEATDDQWKKCIKRNSDEASDRCKNSADAPDRRDPQSEQDAFLNKIGCRRSYAGSFELLVPKGIKQSAKNDTQSEFKEKYDMIQKRIAPLPYNTDGNPNQDTGKCWGLNDKDKLNQLGGKKRRRGRSTKKRKGAKKRKGTKKRKHTKKRKGAKKRKGTKKRKPTKKRRRGTRKARKGRY